VGTSPGALNGAVAQLGERQNRTLEAEGSTPFRSTWNVGVVYPERCPSLAEGARLEIV
jgi:hypothetical protein